MHLPLELRNYIWELSMPRRALDVRNLNTSGYSEIRNSPFPVPHIGRVCREAQNVVLRKGHKLAIFNRFNGPPNDVSSDLDTISHTAGFLTPSDLPMYYVGQSGYENGAYPWNQTSTGAGTCYSLNDARITTARAFPREFKSQDIGTYWPHSELGTDSENQDVLKEWLFLCKLEHLTILTVV
ncbi:hypothetical protein BDW59DRAFT_164360 [Aspergillus cavernicola]|uniref:2EXR domain-containing protein n=1 Tax=Aspergillus cavernicola TaxID=176166 RepID=A0ABR4HZN9_9EURO